MVRNAAEIGYELPGITKTFTLEASQVYCRWPEVQNYHTDEAAAKSVGFPSVIMQGMMGVSYLSQLCHQYFGEEWTRSGKLSVNFIGLVYPPQCLKIRGVVREKINEEDRQRLVLDVWIENEKKEKVHVGKASACVSCQK